MIDDKFFDKVYFESGPQSGKSLYQNYSWLPELTIPLAYRFVCEFQREASMGLQQWKKSQLQYCGYPIYAKRKIVPIPNRWKNSFTNDVFLEEIANEKSNKNTIMDFGCAKGYLVHAFRLLGIEAYGVDISEYAISKAPKEVNNYISLIKPYSDNFRYCTYIICKDILEHIPYDKIDEQLSILKSKCEVVLAIIPLGNNGKYVIPAYELDKSHYIREPKEWWNERFEKAGFTQIKSTTNLGAFKAQWQEIDSNGNLLYMGF